MRIEVNFTSFVYGERIYNALLLASQRLILSDR